MMFWIELEDTRYEWRRPYLKIIKGQQSKDHLIDTHREAKIYIQMLHPGKQLPEWRHEDE